MTDAVHVRFFGKLASLTAAMLFLASVASAQEFVQDPRSGSRCSRERRERR